jgi:hypothetical protein
VQRNSSVAKQKKKYSLHNKATKGTKKTSLHFSQKNLRALCGFVAKESFCCEAKEKMQLKI